jgi:hypothetical protein
MATCETAISPIETAPPLIDQIGQHDVDADGGEET